MHRLHIVVVALFTFASTAYGTQQVVLVLNGAATPTNAPKIWVKGEPCSGSTYWETQRIDNNSIVSPNFVPPADGSGLLWSSPTGEAQISSIIWQIGRPMRHRASCDLSNWSPWSPWYITNPQTADTDFDCVVGNSDFSLMQMHWGGTCW